MKVPRDISGLEFAGKLDKYGYRVTRQAGSHMRLTTTFKGTEHHITIPAHDFLKIGTFNSILDSLAAYLELDKETLIEELFPAGHPHP